MSQPYSEKTGKLIDAWIRLRRIIDKYQKSVTDYINIELAEKADLSGRQIERMRRYDGFPEDKSMTKLINAIPDLKSLDCSDFAGRLLLQFEVVELAQNRIKAPPKGELNTIVIIAGWLQPLGINQDVIAQATTKNVNGDFEYVFLYPDPETCPDDLISISPVEGGYAKTVQTQTEKWVDSFRQICEGIRASQLSRTFEDREKIRAEVQRFEKSAKKKMSRRHTSQQDSKFWFLLPSKYTVLYNPDKPINSGFDRYGMFNVKGKLIEVPSLTLEKEEIDRDFLNSGGWLYMNEEEFDDLAELYSKIEYIKE
jgi:hypothetical protein